ncbi:MAG: hypothetical protein IT338_17565 [Thermomicrobiales bacterium]|nr:hypothetical protein [Thermomicrobiales bacterium]
MGSESKAEAAAAQATLARDFVMARCAAARASLQAALESIDQVLLAFVAPDTDPKGKDRTQALEDADAALGDAASSIHAAMSEFGEIDPAEGEPEADDDDDDDDEDEDEDDDDDEDDEEQPRRRGGRR